MPLRRRRCMRRQSVSSRFCHAATAATTERGTAEDSTYSVGVRGTNDPTVDMTGQDCIVRVVVYNVWVSYTLTAVLIGETREGGRSFPCSCGDLQSSSASIRKKKKRAKAKPHKNKVTPFAGGLPTLETA